MKRTATCIMLAAVLVFSLALLQGCTSAGSGQNPGSEAPTASQSEEPSQDADSGQPDEGPESSRQEEESGVEPATPPEEDETLLREILLEYGAVYEEPDGERMKTEVLSLFYADEWSEPEDLPCGAYYSWFMTTIWTEDLTDEEREEKYTLPNRAGWAFPQDIYEDRITSRFDVSVEYLRSDESIYLPEEGVYSIGGGGGIGMRPYVELQSVRREGDLLLLDIQLEYAEEYEEDQAWQLTVRLEDDGGWKYQSWMRAQA